MKIYSMYVPLEHFNGFDSIRAFQYTLYCIASIYVTFEQKIHSNAFLLLKSVYHHIEQTLANKLFHSYGEENIGEFTVAGQLICI